ELAAETGMRPSWRTHAFRDPAESVRRDIVQLRHDPFLHPDTRVRGFVLDIHAGVPDEIVVDGPPPRRWAARSPGGRDGSPSVVIRSFTVRVRNSGFVSISVPPA